MGRDAKPMLTREGQMPLDAYAAALHADADLRPATERNYLADLRHFAAWCEATWGAGVDEPVPFAPERVATPTLTAYRANLQSLGLAPATINRHLISLKRYCAWATTRGRLGTDPARAVKLVARVPPPPRQLDDREEAALVAAVTQYGPLRDRALIVLALHTGLRAAELCQLRPGNLRLGTRSGEVAIWGKRTKHRLVPLNATARAMLAEYLPSLPPGAAWLFPSRKGATAVDGAGTREMRPVGERALGHLVARYAELGRVADVSPHDLRHRFGYRMAATVPLHRLAEIMGHDSLDTTRRYVAGTRQDLQRAVETIAWV